MIYDRWSNRTPISSVRTAVGYCVGRRGATCAACLQTHSVRAGCAYRVRIYDVSIYTSYRLLLHVQTGSIRDRARYIQISIQLSETHLVWLRARPRSRRVTNMQLNNFHHVHVYTDLHSNYLRARRAWVRDSYGAVCAYFDVWRLSRLLRAISTYLYALPR